MIVANSLQRCGEALGDATELVHMLFGEEDVVLSEALERLMLAGELQLDLLDLASVIAVAVHVMLDGVLLDGGGMPAIKCGDGMQYLILADEVLHVRQGEFRQFLKDLLGGRYCAICGLRAQLGDPGRKLNILQQSRPLGFSRALCALGIDRGVSAPADVFRIGQVRERDRLVLRIGERHQEISRKPLCSAPRSTFSMMKAASLSGCVPRDSAARSSLA